jgi:type II secretion system protein H
MITGRAARLQKGFTLVEMLIVVAIIGTVSLIATTSYRNFRERSTLNRAARVVAADMALARTYAIRNRANVTLVAIESARRYEIRDGAGNVIKNRWFDDSSDLALASLDVKTTGDSLTFNSRGLLTTGLGLVDVGRQSGTLQVQVNAVGRSRVVIP